MKATVCLPTYNERENLERVVRRLGEHGVSVLVIDDDSPDGTGEIADRLAAELEYVSVLHRERKEGLGPAYLAGFRRALADGADVILEMDCDFSHKPDDVPAAHRGHRRGGLRARLALCPRRRDRRTGASSAASSRGPGRPTRRCCWACGCAT